jgi:hypothetical protein
MKSGQEIAIARRSLAALAHACRAMGASCGWLMRGPEWLTQLSKMNFSNESAYALPPDIELSVENAERLWGE